MRTIDNLFALPAPLALLKTLIHPRDFMFFPIFSSILIHALLLVNVLASGALTVAPSEQVSRDMKIPIFNLTSQAQFAAGTLDPIRRLSLESLHLTTMGEERINSVLLDLPEVTWDIPQDCGLKCTFYFEYNAPGLKCHDVIPDGSQGPPLPDLDYTVYQANSNLYPRNMTASPSQGIDVDSPYDLSINYTGITNAFSPNMTFSPTAGTYCRFYQAIYNASFDLNSNSSTQRASTSIISYGDYLSWGETPAIVPFYVTHGEPNLWAICYAFALAFQGNFSIFDGGDIAPNQPVLASIFNIDTAIGSFELATPDLSQTLVELFSNLTLGLISTRGGKDPVIANATIWGGSNIWIYTSWVLWAVYLPALILAIAVALYGLYTIHVSGIAMDDKFSSFLLATQNVKLYEMCGDAADFEELQNLQLIHHKKGTFHVV
jgi:hypothetical protein